MANMPSIGLHGVTVMSSILYMNKWKHQRLKQSCDESQKASKWQGNDSHPDLTGFKPRYHYDILPLKTEQNSKGSY